MNNDVYLRLAQRLDAIPMGFSSTKSGVELRLLAKIFTPDEALLASVMRLTAEPISDIASRADIDFEVAHDCLNEMVDKGLIYANTGEDQVTFGLMSYVDLSFEQLSRMDLELAQLIEQYIQETEGGSIVNDSPPAMRIIPVDEAIPRDAVILPYERASELVEEAKSWSVRDCFCRVQRKLIGKGCDHPTETCLRLAPYEAFFEESDVDRLLTKEEALNLLKMSSEAGLVHTTENQRDGHWIICSCCTCSCEFLRAVTEFGHLYPMASSDFRSTANAEFCDGCGECIEHCQFGALSLLEGNCLVDNSRCHGCGLCIASCPTNALSLERVPDSERVTPPINQQEWMIQRSEARGIALSDIL